MLRVPIVAASSSVFPRVPGLIPAKLLQHSLLLLTILGGLAADTAAQSRPPVADPNVNMVRGLGDQFSGDPYLQRQNEPSIAVSTRNACHLLGGANDYRTVDVPDETGLPNSGPQAAGDAWLGVFRSYDCANRWQSALIPGYPQDTSPEGLSSPLKGFQAAADPTVRAGTNGLFYYSGIVFNRGEGEASRVFVARYQDFNDKERGDSIRYLGITVLADGQSGQFNDKPWMAVDIPRSGYGPAASYWTTSDTATHGNSNGNAYGNNAGLCDVNGQQVPGGNVYVAWARFDGNSAGNPSKIVFARSTDCGRTFKASPISDNQKISQGAMIAIAPDDGTVYVAWREFGRNGKPHSIHIMRSRDGGQTWDKPQPVVASFTPFDQGNTEYTFRTNALPTIAAAPGGLVYVAYAARGAAMVRDANGTLQPTDDARVMLAVSTNAAQTFAAPVVVDNPPDRRGHQIMPALSYAAGKLQILFYDFRDDVSPDRSTWISDSPSVTPVRHTVDVRGAWADATATPQFSAPGGTTEKLSQYAVSASLGTVQLNYANLPLYGLGKAPFLGDYIDAQGLLAVPVRSADGLSQEWRPNIGPIDFTGLSALSAQAYPSLPVFHLTWTDHRDVKMAPDLNNDGKPDWDQYTTPGATQCNPKLAGIRNANIYTSRITPGLFAGSPGNTKPLGTVMNPKTGQRELLQRGFAVFVQNTLTERKRYRLTIANQPAGGVASFRQFDRPAPGCEPPATCPPQPLTVVDVNIPSRSTIARTVYVKATDQYAQVLVNIVEVDLTGHEVTVDGRKTIVHDEVPNGLRASVLLNPDRTNPPIADPDLELDPDDPHSIPQIAQVESHDPAISPPFYVDVNGLLSTKRAIAVPKNPDPENPDVENPDPENPDPENPDVENPDPENPDVENPDPENPDPENPDPENPDPENPDVENPDVENLPPGETITAIRDVHWTVKNRGNTTSAYHFRPTLKPGVDTTGLHFQLLVTRRYLIPALTASCKVLYRTESQVVVNVPGYTPRTPDPENPDVENPDPENPDPENPDVENPDPENPDPENPDVENVSFILAPDESATVTLRIIKVGSGAGGDAAQNGSGPSPDIPVDLLGGALQSSGGEIDFSPRQETGAVVIPQAADTGQTVPTSASAGPDLVLSDPMPTANTPAVVPPGQLTLSFTIHNRGTGEAIAYTDGDPLHGQTTIKTRFYLSADNVLSRDDVPLAPSGSGTPGAYEFFNAFSGTIPPCTETAPAVCLVPLSQTLEIPRTTLPGEYYVFAIVDDDNDWDDDTSSQVDNEVFEADDYNNRAAVGPITIGYSLAFAVQPVETTQDMYITPTDGGGAPLPVTVSARYSDGTPAPVAQIAMSLGTNPAGGTLSGTLVQPTAGGAAAFSDLSINNPSPTGTTYTLVASAGGAFPATSSGFAVLADAPPVVTNDNYTMFEDGTLIIPPNGVLVNDHDPAFKGVKQPTRNPRPSPGCPDGWCIQASLGTGPAQGNLSAFNLDGSFTYAPPLQFNGPVTFTYRANDGRPGNDTTGTVTITVVGVNDPPSFTKGSDQTVAEDAGAQSAPGWATSISAGPGESAQTVDFIVSADNTALFAVQPAISPAGTLTYTPAPNANGTANITVRIHDNGGTDNGGVDTSAPQTFVIRVTEVNDPPVPAADGKSTAEDTVLAFPASDLAANDSAGPTNEAGQLLTVTAVATTASTHGTISLAAGTVTYTPDANYNGPASFSYTVCDNGTTNLAADPKCATGIVNVTVSEVNDAPVPVADSRTTPEDTILTFAASTLSTNDAAGPANETGQVLTVTAVESTVSTHGTVALAAGSVTYSPALNYNGAASFTYTVCDNGTTAGAPDPKCATGTANVTLSAVNDAPVAVNDTATTAEDTPVAVAVLANDSDPDGDALTVTGAAPVTGGGTVTVNANNTVTYTPALNFNGTATFSYTISDGHGGTASATASVTVTGINDPPVAVNDAVTTPEDTAVVVSVLANDSDPDGNALAVTGATPVSGGGTVTVNPNNTVTYAPAANFNGTATFTYSISDGFGGTASATVTVTVTPVNDPPDAVNDTFTVAEDSGATTLNVRANDTIAPDTGETLTVTAVTQPASGTVTIATGGTGVIYTPPTNFNGVVSFTYTISDGSGGTDTATVTVTVTPVNDAPVAVNDAYVAGHNETLAIAAPGVLANDSDVEGTALTVALAKNVLHGTLTLNANGSFTYTPNAGFAGADNFRYQASDGSLTSAVADVNITVLADQLPIANPDTATTNEDTAIVIPVLSNDSDPDSDPLTVSAVTAPLHGTATITGSNTTVTYQPALNYSGSDSFTYTVSDGKGGTAVGTVSVTVTAVNDPPVAANDAAMAIAGNTTPIDVLANDTDVESRLSLAVTSSIGFVPSGLPYNIGFSGELAVVPAAGRLYVGTSRAIAVYSLATNALDALIPLRGQATPQLHRLDAAAGILYFRTGMAIMAVDVRPASPTFNTILGTATFAGSLNSFAVDDVAHRLYVVHAMNAGGAPTQRQLDVVNGDPASPGFLSIIATFSVPGSPIGVAVNTATNKIYLANSSGNTSLSGLYVLDGATLQPPARITLADGTTGVPPCFDVVVDPSTNMVYGYGTASPNGNIVIVDAANGNAVTTVPVANFWATNVAGKVFAINTVTHRVYAWSGDFYTPGKLVVIDGDRSSGTFKTLTAEIPAERDYCDVVVDEVHNRVLATADMGVMVVNGATSSVAGVVRAKQLTCDIDVNPASGRAYVSATTGVQILDIAGTPAEVAATVTAAEVGFIVADPVHHVAYTTRTLGVASVLAVTRGGVVTTVPGLPTDAGRYISMARNGTTNKIYAANIGASVSGGLPYPGFVAVIDGSTGAVIKTITVGDQPLGMGINEVTNRIYVANAGADPGTISVIDGSTDTLLTTVTAPPDIVYFQRDVVANTTTNKVYLRTSSASDPLWVLDGATNTLSRVALPAGTASVALLRVNSEKNRIYVGLADGHLYVLNGANDSVVANLMVGYPSSAVGTQSYLAINEVTDEVWVANFTTDTVTVLNYDGGSPVDIDLCDGPTAVATNDLTNTVYVACANDKILAVIDGATRAPRGGLALPYQINFIAVDPSDRRIYGSSGGAPQDIGLTIVADDPVGPNDLTIASVTNGTLGTAQILLDRLVLYTPSPAASGVDTFTYTATDGTATSNAATVTVTIAPPLTITTSSLPGGRSGTAYNQTILATGGTGARTWLVASGNIPSGTTLDAATGAIRGTPNMPGQYTFTVRVQDSAPVPQVATMMFSIGIGPLVITTGSLPSGWVGQSYSATLTAVPITGTAVWSIASGSLPQGSTLSPSGVISGTPGFSGSSSFTVRVTDGSGDVATRPLSIYVDAPLQIITPPRVAQINQSYSTQYVGGRGTRNWTLAAGTLPRGMSFSSTSGITGTPIETGHFPITLTVTDCYNNSCAAGTPVQTDTKTFTLHAASTDQSINWNSSAMVAFGASGYSRIAQVFTAAMSGELVSVQPAGGMTCPWPTVVSAEIRRLMPTPPFAPDDSPAGLFASATVTMSNSTSMTLDTPVFFPIGAKFAVVLTASGACSLPTNTGSDYVPGVPFVFDGTWQLPSSLNDLGITTYIVPPPGLIYTVTGRYGAVATPLLDGRILVTSNSTAAEVYDPASGTTTATANNLQVARNSHAAVLLTCPSGTGCGYHGKVLVAGGEYYDSVLQRSVSSNTAELYDPATNRFTVLAGTLAVGRSQFTMTRLSNATVLIAGGQARDGSGNWSNISSAEIFDPGSMSFTQISDMLVMRRQHTATLLPNGKVLIVGGWTWWNGQGPTPTAELFNPTDNTFQVTTGGTVDGFVRAAHTATALADGRVVIAGGIGWWPDLGDSIEIYDPATDSFTRAGTIAVRRMNHAAVPLDDGRVLLAGGTDRWIGTGLWLTSVEIYDPQTQLSTPMRDLLVPRSQAGAGRLACPPGTPHCPYEGDVFLLGGSSSTQVAGRSIEIVDPHVPAAALVMATMTLPNGQTGQAYPGASVAATGGTPPYSFSIASGSLPPTVVLEATGAIHSLDGTVLTTAGGYQFVVKVRDSLGAEAYQSFSIAVNVLTITTSSLPPGVVGLPYDAVLEAAGTPPYTWSYDNSIGGPPGVAILPNGHVSFTPTQTGCWSLGARVRDGSFQIVSKAISSFCFYQPLDITSSPALGDAFLKQWFDYQLGTNSGSSQGTWSLALQPGEHLPRGFEVSTDGRVRGNALETGVFTFTVQVAVASSPPQTDQQTFTLRVGANDQWGSGDGVSMTPFGTSGHQRVAEIVTTGATGGLMAVRPRSVVCPSGVSVTAEIRRLTSTPPFVPDDSAGGLLASQTVTPNSTVSFATPIFFPVGARFAIVLSADGPCQARVNPNDSYTLGEPYVFDGASWQPPADFQELGFDTYIFPQGLIYTNGWAGQALLTPLLDGRVLLTSDGQDAEVYDPATGRFTPTGNSMQMRGGNYAAVLLSNGKVLIAGGEYCESTQQGCTWRSINSAELYDPSTNQFTPVPNPLVQGRSQFTMTRLADGKVLLAGGQIYDQNGYWTGTPSAEIFDPALLTFTPVGDMAGARREHTASLISTSGKVLIVGGWTEGAMGPVPTAELFDPTTGTFSATAGGTASWHSQHSATALPDGNVVIIGGSGNWPEPSTAVEIYNAAQDSFEAGGSTITPRMGPATALLADGRVLVAGGYEKWFGAATGLASVEIYDPVGKVSALTGDLNVLRGYAAAILVGTDVLVAGGGGASSLSGTSAEIVHVVAGSTPLTIATSILPAGHTGQPYPGATLVTAGGTGPFTFSLASGSLPPGVELSGNQLRAQLDGGGQPVALNVAGAFQFIVKVTDSLGAQAYRNLQISIDAPTIETTSIPSGVVNQPYDVVLSASGAAPLTWSLDPSYGWIPTGLAISTDGHLYGTSTQSGCWSFGVRVRDASFQTVTGMLTLCINEPLQVNPPPAPWDALVPNWFDTWFNAAGGGSQRTWSLDLQPGDHLPSGLQVTTDGRLFGNVLETGVFTFTVRVTDNSSPPQSATGQFAMRSGAEDQVNWAMDPSATLAIDGSHQVAQVVRAGATGRLLHVVMPVACSTGNLTIQIRGVTPAGVPDGSVRASTVVPWEQIPPFPSGPYFRAVALSSPPSLTVNEYFSIVLSSDGDCVLTQTSEMQYRWWAYPYGDGFTGDGSTWTSLGATSRPVLPFRTFFDAEGRLAFAHLWRSQHAATTLNDGTILMTGGTGGGQPRALIYDPATNSYAPTTGDMLVPRNLHTATLLADGRVLITGGFDCTQPNCPAVPTVEIYDPVSRTFSPLAGLLAGRGDHTATLLADGRVLIAGGGTGGSGGNWTRLNSTEIYEVGVGSVPGPDLAQTHNAHTATTLADGRVLIIGGSDGPLAEIYSYTPGSPGSFAPAGPMNVGRLEHTATRLADNRILVVGGWASTQQGAAPVAELYDPATDTFTVASGPLQTRQRHAATLLANGKVLISGGYTTVDSRASLELYDPATGLFTATGTMATSRSWHTATPLADGRVLLAFGASQSNATGISSEIYDPASPPPAGPISVQTADPPKAYAERPYDVQLTVSGTGPFVWSLAPGSPPLPTGLSLTPDGRITGTPEIPTGWPIYGFIVRVIDAAGHSTTQSFSIYVDRPLDISTTSLGTTWVGWYDAWLGAQGTYRSPLTWSIASGALPAGLDFNTSDGHLTGYIGEAGTFSFTVLVTDSSTPPQTDTQTYTLRVGAMDQGSCCGQRNPADYLAINSGQTLAQIVTAGVDGNLIAVQLPIACSSGDLTAGIYSVKDGRPDYRPEARLAEWTQPFGSLPTPDPNWPGNPTLLLPTPVSVPRGGRFAVVLSSSGDCWIAQVQDWPGGDPYPWGEGFSFDGSTWTPLAAAHANRRDLEIWTFVMPSYRFAFLPDEGRMLHTATDVGGGKVLVAGTAERAAIYDEATGLFTRTAGTMTRRLNHTATSLGGAGSDVLIAGGHDPGQWGGPSFSSAELFHPASGTFEAVGSLTVPRMRHTATRLNDGTVLIAGGQDQTQASLQSTDLYDPSSRTFTAGPTMTGFRHDHTATLLADGRVLIVGGWGGYPTNAEIYVPGIGFEAPAGDLAAPRVFHTATRLNDGTVLIAGGYHPHTRAMIPFAEIFDPITNTFRVAGYLQQPRLQHAATLLTDGRVLLAGGRVGDPGQAEAWTEIYNPSTDTFTLAADMQVARMMFTATTLPDGKVLFAGANGRSWIGSNSAEVYDPSAATTLVIGSGRLPDAVVNEFYQAQVPFWGTGYTQPLNFLLLFGQLPPGLILDVSGLISGVPTATGTFDFVVEVVDQAGYPHVARATFTILINGPLDLQAGAMPGAFVGQMYSHQLTAAGGSGARTWTVTGGSLPAGLALSNTGLITGTPVEAGAFPFDVSVSDATGHSDAAFFSLTVGATPDESTAWTTTFPSGGSIGPSQLAVDPNHPDIVLALPTWRGIYKRESSGAWGNLTDQVEQLPFDRTGIYGVAIGPDGAWHVLSSGVIYRSRDRGVSWTQLWNTVGGWIRHVLPVSADVVYAAGDPVQISRTTDGGRTWTGATTGLSGRVISLTADSSGSVLYAGTDGWGIYKSTDGGANWIQMSGTSGLGHVANICLDPAHPLVMYAAVGDFGGQSAFVKSTDAGATWTAVLGSVSPPGGEFQQLLAIDPDGTLFGLAGSPGNAVRVSADGGETWSETILQRFGAPMVGSASAIVVADSSTTYVATYGQGVFATHDSGLTWNYESAGMLANNAPHTAAHATHVDSSNSSYVYASTSGGGYRSEDGGATWVPMPLPENWAIAFANGPAGVVYALASDLYQSADHGASWSLVGGSPSSVCCGNGDLAVHFTVPQIIYRAVIRSWTPGDPQNGVYKSSDGGLTWTQAGLTGLIVHTLTVNQTSGAVFAGVRSDAGQPGGIYRTTDGGLNWTRLAGGLPDTLNPNQIIVHPLDFGFVLVGSDTYNGGVYASHDGGDTWSQIFWENVDTIGIHPTYPSVIYAGTWNSGGLYRSPDNGQTWVQMNEGLPLRGGFEAIVPDPSVAGRMFLGTAGGVYIRRF